MATNNRSTSKRGSSARSRSHNNNPEGHNQYTGMMTTARENPLTTAAAVGGAVAAGVFLWSRRNQISDQLVNLSDQISEWRESYSSTNELGTDFASSENTETDAFIAKSSPRRSAGRKTQSEIAEEALTLKQTGEAIA
ncbi:MAG: hypothetical protein ABIW33_07960 [Sphingomicrobium sp.]